MITICPEDRCTGCAACFNICSKECILMTPDTEGFLCPEIDVGRCDDCGACKRVCPILHTKESSHLSTPLVYACWNKDDTVRLQSASGGAFSVLAEHILDNGGVVFGAAFDEEMQLKHIGVHKIDGLKRLRSSKYVQSDIGRTYCEAQDLLRQNKKVLFAGTPCQISALYALVGSDNENLLTCDMLCKGVPSPGLFAGYLSNLEKRFKAKLVNINFRNKDKGWELISTTAVFGDGRQSTLSGYDNSFMFGFSNGFTIRNSCYRCPYASVDRKGDLTLGDFWGIGEIAPFKYSKRNGVSLILVNSEKGNQLFGEVTHKLYSEKRTFDEAKHKQVVLERPFTKPKNREGFFADYQRLEYEDLAKLHLVDKGVKGLIKRLVPRTWIFHLRKLVRKVS